MKLLLKIMKKILKDINYNINCTNTHNKMDDRIKIIIESWRSVCVEYSSNAFKQAGFYIDFSYKNQKQASNFVKNNEITKVYEIDLLNPIVKFNWTLDREIKPIIDPENKTPMIKIDKK